MNPLSVKEKKVVLYDYPWSSYQACVGLNESSDFLDILKIG